MLRTSSSLDAYWETNRGILSSSWALEEPSWAPLGAILAGLRAILGHMRATLALFGPELILRFIKIALIKEIVFENGIERL